MKNTDLHTLIANTEDEIARLQAVVEAAKTERLNDPASKRHGNLTAESGCDRCWCGNKYWEFDRCIDCGEMHDAEKIEAWQAIREADYMNGSEHWKHTFHTLADRHRQKMGNVRKVC
jgi:hypothetical protein